MEPDQLMRVREKTGLPADARTREELAERELDARVVEMLERAPQVRIPEDFAARVAASIPADSLRVRAAHMYARIPARRIGYSVAGACLLVLALAMLALAPRTAHSTFYLAIELTLAAQFCVLAAWVAMPRRG